MNTKTWIIIGTVILCVTAVCATVYAVSKNRQAATTQREEQKGLTLGLDLGISNQAIAPITNFLGMLF